MKTITSKDYIETLATVDNLLAGKIKPIFVLSTKRTMFKANDLNTVFLMWKQSNDKSGVMNLQRIG